MAQDICKTKTPPLQPVEGGNEHCVACHFFKESPQSAEEFLKNQKTSISLA
jgi:hypothetical protein